MYMVVAMFYRTRMATCIFYNTIYIYNFVNCAPRCRQFKKLVAKHGVSLRLTNPQTCPT